MTLLMEMPRPRPAAHAEPAGKAQRAEHGAGGAVVDALRAADADAMWQRVVIAGAGPGFCAGADLGERAVLIADPEARAAARPALRCHARRAGRDGQAGGRRGARRSGRRRRIPGIVLRHGAGGGGPDAFSWPEAKHGIYPAPRAADAAAPSRPEGLPSNCWRPAGRCWRRRRWRLRPGQPGGAARRAARRSLRPGRSRRSTGRIPCAASRR